MPTWYHIATFKDESGARGHRLFRKLSAPGRIYLADNSGSTPDQTDDGEMWLDFASPVTLSKDYIGIPLVKGGATGYRTRDDVTKGNLEIVANILVEGGSVKASDFVGELLANHIKSLRVFGLEDAPRRTDEEQAHG